MRLVLLLLCFWCSAVFSQLQFKGFHYTTDEGLPSNTIYSITEDNQGNIVLGTDNGLTFFNGNAFENLNVQHGLINPYVVALTKDEKGTIWLVTYGGKLQKIEQGKITTTSIFTEYYNQILSVDKSLFLFTTQARVSGKLYKSVELFRDKGLKINSDTLHVNPIVAAPVLQQDGEIIHVINRNISYKNYRISLPQSVTLLHKVIFRKEQIYLLDNKNLIVIDYQGNVVKTIQLPQELSKKRFYKFDFITDQKDNCWLSIQGKGLFVLRDNSWQNVHSSLGLNEDQNINFLYCDSQDRLWIATHENGLFCIPNATIQILHIPHTENNFNGFALSANGKSLYAATNFRLYEYAKGKFNFLEKTLLPIKLENIGRDPVYCFPYFKVDKHDTELRSMQRMIGRQLIKQEGDIYYSLFGLADIAIWKRQNKGTVIKYITNKVPSNEKIRKVVFHKGEYYFNNSQKIDIRTFDRNFIYKKRVLNIKKKGFISDFEFINDTMWVAVNDNIYKVVGEKITDSITEVNNARFYNIRKIKTIGNAVFICAGNGLFRISQNGNRVLNKYNFLNNNDVYNVTLFNDELFVATIDGISKIPNSLVGKQSTAPSFEIMYENRNVSEIELPKDVGHVTLHLNIQNFYDKKNQTLEYKIDDSQWVSIIGQEIVLQELAYGNHEVHFRIKDINSNWTTKTLHINRIYPFYKHWEFYLLVFVLFCFAVYLIYIHEVRVIKSKKQFEINRNNKMVELRQSALSAMMNPHFVFNSLNAIQYFINSNQSAQSSDYLGKLAHLMRLFLEHSAEPFITLKEEISRLKLYVELEQLRFSHFDFELEADENLNQSNIKIPNMIVQPFIENAILHGVSHLADNDGKVGLHFSITGSLLTIIITDNGFGRQQSNNKNSSHISKGINIITERLAILQQSYPEKVFTITEQAIDLISERKGHKVILRVTVFD